MWEEMHTTGQGSRIPGLDHWLRELTLTRNPQVTMGPEVPPQPRSRKKTYGAVVLAARQEGHESIVSDSAGPQSLEAICPNPSQDPGPLQVKHRNQAC